MRLLQKVFDTPTAHQLVAALPITRTASTWGDEVYFPLPFAVEAESNATNVVDVGTVCVWFEGNSLALHFGPTPISQGSECRLISPANIVGSIRGDSQVPGFVKAGVSIRVEHADMGKTA